MDETILFFIVRTFKFLICPKKPLELSIAVVFSILESGVAEKPKRILD
jgi:hypothetical protein